MKKVAYRRKIQNVFFHDDGDTFDIEYFDGHLKINNTKNLKEGDILDFEDDEDDIKDTNNEYFDISSVFEAKIYKNKFSSKSIYIRSKNRFVLKKFIVADDSYLFQVDFNLSRTRLPVTNLFVSIENSNPSMLNLSMLLTQCNIKNNTITFSVKKDYLDNFFTDSNQVASFFVGENEAAYRVFSPKDETSNISKGVFGEALIKSTYRTKIFVLGSCYSRRLFTSTEYFNKNYKDFFDVTGTQFQSSLIAITQKKQVEKFPHDIFVNQPKSVQTSVKNELENSFFYNLKNLDIDYLILDIYADIDRGICFLEGDKIVTFSNYVSNKTSFLNGRKFQTLAPLNSFGKYNELFKKAVTEFRKEILSILPEEKLILNHVVLATEYFDEKEQIKKFVKRSSEIRNKNIISEAFFNILKNEFPRAHIVKTDNRKYRASAKSPDGLTYNHYETEYYKDKMTEIKKIIE